MTIATNHIKINSEDDIGCFISAQSTSEEMLMFQRYLRNLGIKNSSGINKTGITTNGYKLDKFAEQLVESGLDGINISIDSLDKNKFHKITGHDRLSFQLIMLTALIVNISVGCVFSLIPLKQKSSRVIVIWTIIALSPIGFLCSQIF